MCLKLGEDIFILFYEKSIGYGIPLFGGIEAFLHQHISFPLVAQAINGKQPNSRKRPVVKQTPWSIY